MAEMALRRIQKHVAAFYGVSLSDMVSKSRRRRVVRPRQVAMYLMHTLALRSFPEIGQVSGHRDHTTVMHGVRKVRELIDTDVSFAEDVNEIRLRMQEELNE